MADFSLADVSALMDRDKGGFGDNAVGWIILLFIFLLAISGNGFWGNNGANTPTQASLTTAELYSALGNQDLKNDVRSGFQGAMDRTYLLDKDILENRYTTQLGFQNLGAQMQSCCCDLKTTVIEQNQATRDLIQANYIDGLRTALSDAKTTISNNIQSAYILGQLGQFYSNPSVNPYTCYDNCNCGCGCRNLN